MRIQFDAGIWDVDGNSLQAAETGPWEGSLAQTWPYGGEIKPSSGVLAPSLWSQGPPL